MLSNHLMERGGVSFGVLVYHSQQLRRSAQLPDHLIPLKTDKGSAFNSILKGGWETPSQTAPQGALLRKQLFQKSCMDCRHEKSPHFVGRQAVKISVFLSYGQIHGASIILPRLYPWLWCCRDGIFADQICGIKNCLFFLGL